MACPQDQGQDLNPGILACKAHALEHPQECGVVKRPRLGAGRLRVWLVVSLGVAFYKRRRWARALGFKLFCILETPGMLRLLQVSESTAKPVEELLVPGFVLPGDLTGQWKWNPPGWLDACGPQLLCRDSLNGVPLLLYSSPQRTHKIPRLPLPTEMPHQVQQCWLAMCLHVEPVLLFLFLKLFYYGNSKNSPKDLE